MFSGCPVRIVDISNFYEMRQVHSAQAWLFYNHSLETRDPDT